MKTSDNTYTSGRLVEGYDYTVQAWVTGGKYVRCGHPEAMRCGCYGREHAGERTQAAQSLVDLHMEKIDVPQ